MIFKGKTPRDLGVDKGRFTARPTWKPNWVSSQVDAGDKHHIEAIAFTGDAASALKRLKSVVENMDGARIVEEKPGYLYVQFSSRLMGFVDDVEFHASGKAIQVRSSSRLGIRDFGVNRKRVEAIRRAFSG